MMTDTTTFPHMELPKYESHDGIHFIISELYKIHKHERELHIGVLMYPIMDGREQHTN